jgi:hypothetical protein
MPQEFVEADPDQGRLQLLTVVIPAITKRGARSVVELSNAMLHFPSVRGPESSFPSW